MSLNERHLKSTQMTSILLKALHRDWVGPIPANCTAVIAPRPVNIHKPAPTIPHHVNFNGCQQTKEDQDQYYMG